MADATPCATPCATLHSSLPPQTPLPLQDILSQSQPDFAAALTIYTNGKNAFRDDGITPRTM